MEWKDIALEFAKLVQSISVHAWKIGVRQSISVGIQNLVGFLICLAVFIYFWRLFQEQLAKCQKDPYMDSGDNFILIMSLIVCVFVFGIGLGCLFSGIANLANPEYYAVKHLMHLVGLPKQ